MTAGIEAGTAAIEEEGRRLRQLRITVDLTTSILMQTHLTHAEAVALVAATRERALALFPDKADTYDLILAPRFARLVREFVDGPSAKVLSFPLRPLAD
jgi:hypothetical protein